MPKCTIKVVMFDEEFIRCEVETDIVWERKTVVRPLMVSKVEYKRWLEANPTKTFWDYVVELIKQLYHRVAVSLERAKEVHGKEVSW